MDQNNILKSGEYKSGTLLAVFKQMAEEEKFDLHQEIFFKKVVNVVSKHVEGADFKPQFDDISEMVQNIIRFSKPKTVVRRREDYEINYQKMMKDLTSKINDLLNRPGWEYPAIDFDRLPYEDEGLGKLSDKVVPLLEEITFLTIKHYHESIREVIYAYDDLFDIYLPISMLKDQLRTLKITGGILGGEISKEKLLREINLPGVFVEEIKRDFLLPGLLESQPKQADSIECLRFSKVWAAILAVMTNRYKWGQINYKFCRLLQNLRIARLLVKGKQLEASQRTSLLAAFLISSIEVGVPQFDFNISLNSLKGNDLENIVRLADFIFLETMEGRKSSINIEEAERWLRRLFTANRGKGYGLNGLLLDPTSGKLEKTMEPILLQPIQEELTKLADENTSICRTLSDMAENQRKSRIVLSL